jgi:hypothetical protein
LREIFVSYAAEDRARVARLVHALEADGLQLWWDRDIDSGQSFHTVIEQALTTASCVIAVWTHDSVQSAWVINEASEARKRACLVPVLFDSVDPPLEFRHLQAAELVGWDGDLTDPAYTGLRKSLVTALGSLDPPQVAKVGSLARSSSQTWPGRMFGVGGLLTGISILLFTLWWVGLVGRSSDNVAVTPFGTPAEPASGARGDALSPKPTPDATPAPEPANLLGIDTGARLVNTNLLSEERWSSLFTAIPMTANLYVNDFAVLAFARDTEMTFDTLAVYVDQTVATAGVKDLDLYISTRSATGPFVKAAQIRVPNFRDPQHPFHQFHFAPVRARFVRIQLVSFYLGGTGFLGSIRLYDRDSVTGQSNP